MQYILLMFRADVSPAQQAAVLAQIETWEGIRGTAPLQPDAADPDLGRIYYAHLTETANVQAILQRLLNLPEIESAELPTGRHLL